VLLKAYTHCQKCGKKWKEPTETRYCDSCLRKNLSLSIYRRHKSKCPERADRHSRACRCTLWATNILDGKRYRRSLHTGDWDEAFKQIQLLENGNNPEQPKRIPIQHALDAFIRDCESRNLNASTLAKYRRLVSALGSFATDRAIGTITTFTADACRDFRGTRKLSPRTASKELERLRAFFKFCVENDWLTKNPAKAIKAPKVKLNPRLPFSEKEIQNVLAKAKDDRELAFILVLRHTGLRIGDASLLKVSALSDGRIFLHTTKAGTPVSILIPDTLLNLLKNLPPNGGYFFLRGESTSMHTTADLWRRRIKILCKVAGVMPDHPHRFRHSLAADLLSKGASVEDVAAILGNSPAVVIKYYAQWIASRQTRLDDFMKSTWKPTLALLAPTITLIR
jgi:integrase/recombinase XerD